MHKARATLLDLLLQKLARTGDWFTRNKSLRAIDVLLEDAERDPGIEFFIMYRKGGTVLLRGVKNGKQIKVENEFEKMLQPIVNNLRGHRTSWDHNPAHSADH